MGDKFMKSTSKLAVAVAAGLFFAAAPTVASAADLGGNCCADLEERVAELEASTVRKGNRKVSLSLSGWVSRQIMIWNATDAGQKDSDVYSTDSSSTSSRFRMKGGASITSDVSAGFLMELSLDGSTSMSNQVSQNTIGGASQIDAVNVRHTVLFLKSKTLGTVYLGHSSESTDGITEIDLSGTRVISGPDVADWNGKFFVNNGVPAGNTWSTYVNSLDGRRGDAVIRYDTPTIAGFTGSLTYAEDDWFSAALRYANEFGGVLRVAAGIGYSKMNNELTGTFGGGNGVVAVNGPSQETISGSLSAMHVPTGLNITVAAGQQDRNGVGDISDKSYWYVKGGIKQRWTSLGATALYGEYGSYDTASFTNANSAQATVWGLGIVQNIDAAAMEVFAAYRDYSLDTVAANDYSAAMLGARIKF